MAYTVKDTSECCTGTQKNGKSAEYVHTFEEAIELARVGRFHYMLLLICGLCFMSVMAETMGIGYVMPVINCDLNATQAEQGLLVSAGFFGLMVSSHMMGFLADTWGRVPLLRYALILAICTTIISAFSVNVWMLLTFRFLNGFFICGCQACVFTLCGEFHSNKSRARYITLLSVFMPVALFYLPGIALVILPLNINFDIFGMTFVSWRAFLIFHTLISVMGLLGLCTLPETPKYTLIQGDHDRALEVLRQMYAKNTGEQPDSFPVKRIVLETCGASLSNIHGVKDALKMIWTQTVPLFYKERVLHTINICFCLVIIFGVAQGTAMWYPTILHDMIAKREQALGLCNIITSINPGSQTNNNCNGEVDTSIFQVLMFSSLGFIVTYLIFAYTIDIVGKVNLLMIWLVICAAAAVIVHWIYEFAASVIFLTIIVSVGNCAGIVSTISMEFFPTNINAMGMCFVMMMGRLGAVGGSNLIGFLLFNYCDILFWGVAGFLILVASLTYVLPQRKPTK